mmetsp:Transcript_17759/g.44060  ORF Transcript_17759/g.44060 Transcript_17759/m.44060 type:complete len:145 (-) Transcript_17759:473-907(-)|eukprot:CAMPEP_0113886278 /NCGR_PEP_ID=MMETSP0780_2-20120614/11448_1 /TAXON_ID=652834 /ORGANISM="Palpitomonas bilix" /LENGTH=144 /DNA_ID=CAMNT_0000874439 /DNA_START=188 /DNA_END=622 /DNA_ORIENTATION=- /assembly_acc=CAM_ASM_000599
MIRFILLQNRQGKTRLARFYDAYEEDEKRQLAEEVYKIVASRSSKYTNFIEFRNYKLITRRYAALHFTFCVDISDNELAFMEIIHLFVETLDKYFGSVCELDLVFNFNKVYSLLDEMVLGGEVQETSKDKVLDRMSIIDGLTAN